MNPHKYNKIAVIGAGPAGITAIKCLREAGLNAVAFEKQPHIGGLWRFDEETPDGGGIAYRSLKTNTSKQLTAFSDFPFPDDVPDFPHRGQVLDYLNAYADHFQLRPFIHLNTTVHTVTPQDNHKWLVTYQQASQPPKSEQFDAVVVAHGFYQIPFLPSLPGQDTFRGQILHSVQYKGPEPFEGSRVVVIGSGSSGADVAGEVGTTAAHVDISKRTPRWFVPHFAKNKPLDNYNSRFTALLPDFINNLFLKNRIKNSYQEMGYTEQTMQSALSLKPFDPDETKVTKGTNILQQALHGRVHIKGPISHIEPDGVRYQNGDKTEADTLIFCTGYTPALPFLDPTIIHIQDNGAIALYKHVFHPEYDNLAFLAQCRVAGPVLPVMEMQARWAAAVFSGTADLPAPTQRKAAIEKRFADARQQGSNPMRVLYADYMDEIAGLIGVRPNLLANLSLLPKLLFGPILPAQYRLNGPGKSEKSKQIIQNLKL